MNDRLIAITEIVTPSQVIVGTGEEREQAGGTLYSFKAPGTTWKELHACTMEYEHCPAKAGSVGIVCDALITIPNSSPIDHLGTVYCGKSPQATDIDSPATPGDNK